MDVPLTLWAIQEEREAEIAAIQLAATVASERASGAPAGLTSLPPPTSDRRLMRGFSSLFAWARQIRSLVS